MCNAGRELFDEFIAIYNNIVVPKPTCTEASSRWIFVIKMIIKLKTMYTFTTCTHMYTRRQ